MRPADTTEAAWEQWVQRWRSATPTEKATAVGQMNEAVRAAALAGIRLRHPEATPQEQRLYLAALLLGDDLVRRAYGWDPLIKGR